MALSDFSNIVVSGDGAALTQVGFGTLLLCAYHTHGSERTKAFTSLTEMADDGFDTDEPAYLMAQVAFSQSPRPTQVKIGRLANAPVQTVRLTPLAANSTAYEITVECEDQDPVTVTYTSDASATVDEICDGLQAAIAAAGAPLAAITVTPVGGATATALDLSLAAGAVAYFSDWDVTRINLEDRTPDPGIAADLDAIRAYDADWYGFAVSVNSKAIAEEAADWAETQDVIFACNTSDWTAHTNGNTTDIQSILDAKSYARTICYFDLDDTAGYSGVAGLAERLPFDPGSPPDAGGVFHARTLRGVTADPLTPTQKNVLLAKGYTVNVTTSTRNHTLGGKAAGGEFLDYTRFVDWFRIRLQEKLAALFMNNGRVPYDERGITMIESVCQAQLREGLASGGISQFDANGNPPKVTVPTLAQTAQNDRAARVLRNVLIEFKYAGAIHTVDPVRITVRV